jgi:predicted nucleic acid-binding protein
MTVILDTSIIIPWLRDIAYERFIRRQVVDDQLVISAVSGTELLAGSRTQEQRRKADALIGRLARDGRIITPDQTEWLRAGRVIAHYQNRFGNVVPADHVNDILILLTGERLGAGVVTENGDDFRLWSRFRPESLRPRLLVLNRHEHVNRS